MAFTKLVALAIVLQFGLVVAQPTHLAVFDNGCLLGSSDVVNPAFTYTGPDAPGGNQLCIVDTNRMLSCVNANMSIPSSIPPRVCTPPTNFQGCWAIKGISTGFGCFGLDITFVFVVDPPEGKVICLVDTTTIYACADVSQFYKKKFGIFDDGFRRLGEEENEVVAHEGKEQNDLEFFKTSGEADTPSGFWNTCLFIDGDITDWCIILNLPAPKVALPAITFTGIYWTGSLYYILFYVRATAFYDGITAALGNLFTWFKESIFEVSGTSGAFGGTNLFNLIGGL